EVADASDWDDVAAFQNALLSSPPSVTEIAPTADLPHGSFDVTWTSPSQGLLEFGTTGAFTVDGAEVDLRSEKRFDNPWMQVPFDSSELSVDIGGRRLHHDYTAWKRQVS